MKSLSRKTLAKLLVGVLILLGVLFWGLDYNRENGVTSWRTLSIGVLNIHAQAWNRHLKINGHTFDRLYGGDRSYAYVSELNSVLFVVRTMGGGFDLHLYDLSKDKDMVFGGGVTSVVGHYLGNEGTTVKLLKREGNQITLSIYDGYEKRVGKLDFDSKTVLSVE